MLNELEKLRLATVSGVRELRRERRWTQAELAHKLALSQSRLSEIERGKGSFTAEQLLFILKLFNVPVTRFAAARARDDDAQIQNALARLGAAHLRENNVLPSTRLGDVNLVIRETLASGAPRLVTALGPVLITNINRVNLAKLDLRLSDTGLERRLPWLVENVRVATSEELQKSPPRAWSKRYRRAQLFLDAYSERRAPADEKGELPLDILDADIRSKKTLGQVRAASSKISKRWGIVTSLEPDDFSNALRAAYVTG